MYVKKSEYLGLREATGRYDYPINDGLFSNKRYKEDEKIVDFVNGEIIDFKELKRRRENGKGGYEVRINENVFLDFYQSKMSKVCFASCANSAFPNWPLKHRDTKENALMNMYLSTHYDHKQKKWNVSYKAMYDLEPNIELFGDYVPYID